MVGMMYRGDDVWWGDERMHQGNLGWVVVED